MKAREILGYRPVNSAFSWVMSSPSTVFCWPWVPGRARPPGVVFGGKVRQQNGGSHTA